MVTIPRGWFYKGTALKQARRWLTRFIKIEGRTSLNSLYGQRLAEELPRRKIYLSAFQIDRHEVSRQAYERCVKRNRCPAIPRPSSLGAFRLPGAPMTNVTWHEARQYCRSLGKRLPTEAEWEKAARGPYGRTWPWGDRWHERACNHGTLHPVRDMYHGSASDGFFWIAPQGSFPRDRSFYGVMDLGGNAAEWVADWYRRGHWTTGKISTHNPTGPSGGAGRLVKGGSYVRLRLFTRAASKRYYAAHLRSPEIGFRCARSVAP